ncbi:MAG: hypothetical protein DRQ62_12775, partial [Gammaproteobacteria bacterium]
LLDKVAIVTQPENVHFSYLAKKFAQQFKEVDGEITDTIYLTTTKQDYIKILETLKSKDPELLYLPLDIDYLFNIKTALSKLNWYPAIMLSDGILANVKVQTEYPLNLLDGMLEIDAYSYNMDFTDFGEQLLKQVSLMGIGTQDISLYSVLGMEGYALLIHTMNQCLISNNSRQACINNAIRSTQRFEGVKGLISFDATGKAHRSLTINQINNGQLDFIVQVY